MSSDSGTDLIGDQGVFKKILREGKSTPDEEGEPITPPKGVEVTVHYVGTLENGDKFDSSRDRNDPFKFKLGSGNVIKGWDIGVATMKKGELAVLKIRSDYGYGQTGSPPKIPGGATLLFEVELLDWSSWEDVSDYQVPNSLYKKVIKAAHEDEWKKPSDDSTVTVTYECKLADGGKVVEQKSNHTFVLGEQQELPALEKICENMKKGEHSLFKVDSSFAYGAKGDEVKGIPPNAKLIYDIELVDFVPSPEKYSIGDKQKLQYAEEMKNKGNEFFKKMKFILARKKYKKAAEYVDVDTDFDTPETKEEAKKLRVALYNNIAAVDMKDGKFIACVENCDKVLKDDPGNVKALFRRSQANVSLSELEVAKNDLKAALEHEPNNSMLQAELAKVDKLVKQQQMKDKKVFSKMFSGLSYDQ